jgi:hypothetical protein
VDYDRSCIGLVPVMTNVGLKNWTAVKKVLIRVKNGFEKQDSF